MTVIDRPPAHDIEAETAVLGAMLLDLDAADTCAKLLRPQHFYRGPHADLFRVLCELATDARPIDAVTVREELKQQGLWEKVGGSSFLTRIMASVPTAANAAHYAGIVMKQAVRREMDEMAAELQRAAHDDGSDPERVIASFAEKLSTRRTSTWLQAPTARDVAALLEEEDPPPAEELVERLITRPGGVICYGASGSGKSYALMAAWLDLVAGGGTFCGVEGLQIRPRTSFETSENQEVVLWVYGSEDPERRIRRRVRELWAGGPHGEKPIPPGRFLIAAPPGGVCLGTPEGVSWLEREIIAAGATVVVLDTVQSLTSATLDSMDALKVARWMAAMHGLRDRRSCVILPVCHTSKTPSDAKSPRGKADALLGSQAWRALSDGMIMIDAPDGDASQGRLRLIKGKDVEDPIPPVNITMDGETKRFRPREEDEDGELAGGDGRTDARQGRRPVLTVEDVLALRQAHPDGIEWAQCGSFLGMSRAGWFKARSKIQTDLLRSGKATVVSGWLRWH